MDIECHQNFSNENKDKSSLLTNVEKNRSEKTLKRMEDKVIVNNPLLKGIKDKKVSIKAI